MRIAIIEDEQVIAEETQQILEGEGFTSDIYLTVADAKEGLRAKNYDAWILDIQMNDDDVAGFGLTRWAEQMGIKTQILVVSGMPENPYKNISRMMNTWDHLTKPVEPAELLFKLKQLLESTRTTAAVPAPNVPNLGLDMSHPGNILWKGRRFSVTLTQYRLLLKLVTKPGVPVTYPEFFSAVTSGKNKESIRQHIRGLREAFQGVDAEFDQIGTETGKGYIWRAE